MRRRYDITAETYIGNMFAHTMDLIDLNKGLEFDAFLVVWYGHGHLTIAHSHVDNLHSTD